MRLRRNREDAKTNNDKQTAFDAFDDESEEKGSSTYGHTPVAGRWGKRTGHWIGVFALLIAVGLTTAFFTVSKIKAREEFDLQQQTRKKVAMLPLVDVAVAKPAPRYKSLVLPAATAAWYRTIIYSRVTGYLKDWKVDLGDRVKKGQVLATIETPDLDAQLDAARAELKAAQAEAKVREADAAFAQSTYNRWRDSPKGVVSEQEREAKKAGAASSVAQLNAANAKVAVDQAKVNGLTTLTGFKNVTAPFDGIITERRIDPGDLVTAGSASSTTPLFVIQQIDRIRVFSSVPQSVAARLSIGSPVHVSTDDGTGRTFDGKITRMTGSLDPQARTMQIETVLPNSDYALAPGMYVRARFEVGETATVRVPASAIVFRAKGPQVAVLGSNGKISFRDVTIVTDDGEFVDLGSGVKAGEDVALNINSQIGDGDKVAVNNSPGAQS
ncbi:efflux RND transporter periplasmic adaptor subunit [Hyphomicrobium sp.]|uniref:efflux RND transporter periplasmic adaptor subunit n=1 Tax=Hyphomicrobium sp. TaxID=82 RepID=UPI002CE04AD8|nr:efflux RND transporter periplasmic adaptor subunit [Hyphomicrobium sp.]HVZ04776.1 efflux RND transporter periplasmic adaptor subunit [Hyphomicrobium sp.]